VIGADAHPDYLSTQFVTEWLAEQPARRHVSVQHHSAHVLSCMADNELEPPVLGVAWDGTGYGWTALFGRGVFVGHRDSIQRRAHLRLFPLPGADKAIKEPRRIALGLLREIFRRRCVCFGQVASRNGVFRFGIGWPEAHAQRETSFASYVQCRAAL